MHFHHQVLPQGWQQLQVKEVITSADQVTPQVFQAHLHRHHRIPEDLQEDQDLLMDQAFPEATDHLVQTTQIDLQDYQEAEAMVHLTDQDPQEAMDHQVLHSRADLQEEVTLDLQVATHRVSPSRGSPSL